MTGGLSNFGMLTGLAFSGGRTTAPLPVGDATVAADVVLVLPFGVAAGAALAFGDDAGEAVAVALNGAGDAVGETDGVTAVAAGG